MKIELDYLLISRVAPIATGNNNIGPLVGGVLGGACVCAVAIFTLYFWILRKRAQGQVQRPDEPLDSAMPAASNQQAESRDDFINQVDAPENSF